jgi:hypothetical protein
VLAFACGDLVESIPISEEGNNGGDGGNDANYGEYKLSRIRDILSVLEKLQNETNCVLYPTYEFHRFCFHKVEYMKQLVKCGVPILPTLFVSKEDWIASSSSNGYDAAQYASQLADEYLRRQQCHWLLPPHFQLNEHTIFIKLDGLWCREGVMTADLALGCDDDPHPYPHTHSDPHTHPNPLTLTPNPHTLALTLTRTLTLILIPNPHPNPQPSPLTLNPQPSTPPYTTPRPHPHQVAMMLNSRSSSKRYWKANCCLRLEMQQKPPTVRVQVQRVSKFSPRYKRWWGITLSTVAGLWEASFAPSPPPTFERNRTMELTLDMRCAACVCVL